MRDIDGQSHEQDSQGAKPRRKSRIRSRFPIIAHPIFTPSLTLWAAIMLALIIAILPASMIARLTMMTGLGAISDLARFVFAGLAFLIGAGIGYGAAQFIRHKVGVEKASGNDASDDMRPINPATELGSESLDAPIEMAEFEEIEDDELAAHPGQKLLESRAAKKKREIETEQSAAETAGSESQPNPVLEPAPTPAASPATGRRRGLAQLANRGASEASLGKDYAEYPDYGASDAEAAAEAASEPLSFPEQTSGEAEPGSWMRRDEAGTQEAVGENPLEEEATEDAIEGSIEDGAAETELAPPPTPASQAPTEQNATPQDYEHPVNLPDAVGAGNALDALIKTASSRPEPAEIADDSAAASGLPEAPVALDLAEFAALEGRNAVWVEEKVPAPAEGELGRPQTGPQVPTALAQLRETPLEELSMMQMVERFAAALADRKEAEASETPPKSNPRRDKALSAALKELTGLASDNASEDTGALGETDTSLIGGDFAARGEIAQAELARENEKLGETLDKLAGLRGAA